MIPVCLPRDISQDFFTFKIKKRSNTYSKMSSDAANTPYSCVALIARKPGVSFEEFKDYYENSHIPMFMKLIGGEKYIKHYTRHYFERSNKDKPDFAGYEYDSADPAGTWGFDVMTHIVYHNKAAFLEMCEKFAQVSDTISKDEKNFLDQGKMKTFFVDDVKGGAVE